MFNLRLPDFPRGKLPNSLYKARKKPGQYSWLSSYKDSLVCCVSVVCDTFFARGHFRRGIVVFTKGAMVENKWS